MTNRNAVESMRESIRLAQCAVDRCRAEKEAARASEDSYAFFSAAGRLDAAIVRLRAANERYARWSR